MQIVVEDGSEEMYIDREPLEGLNKEKICYNFVEGVLLQLQQSQLFVLKDHSNIVHVDTKRLNRNVTGGDLLV